MTFTDLQDADLFENSKYRRDRGLLRSQGLCLGGSDTTL